MLETATEQCAFECPCRVIHRAPSHCFVVERVFSYLHLASCGGAILLDLAYLFVEVGVDGMRFQNLGEIEKVCAARAARGGKTVRANEKLAKLENIGERISRPKFRAPPFEQLKPRMARHSTPAQR